MSVPTTYTIPTTGSYATTDGKERYLYTAGTVISMELAIRLGLPGAGYTYQSPFGTSQETRIGQLAGVAMSDPGSIRFFEDFAFGITTSGNVGMGWGFTGGSLGLQISAPADAFGVVTRTSAATANTNSWLAPALGFVTYNAGSWKYRERYKPTDVDANAIHRFGVGDLSGVAVQISEGVYFEKLGADANWFAVCRTTGVQTRVDTGVAATATWRSFRIEFTPASKAVFYIGGMQVASISTNLPSANLASLGHSIIPTAAVAKSGDIDYIGFEMTGLSR